MPIGPYVRQKLGRFERPATDLYRSMFFNLEEFVKGVRRHAGSPARILEVGCGVGIVTDLLASTFPDSDITGIDICRDPGRLCARTGRTHFFRMTAADLSATEPDPYELIVISDVLHHVPRAQRLELLARCRDVMVPGGVLILKEWVRQRTPAYFMGYLSDRFVTGDDIRYMSEEDLRRMAQDAFGAASIQSQFRIGPWTCNLALVISRA